MPDLSIVDLWIPILVSAVFVFMASSVLHMLLPFHKADYKGVPSEEGVMAKMREAGVQPGHYFFPYCADMKEMASEDFMKKREAGPVGFMTVLPSGPMKMGGQLGSWFAYTVVVGAIVAYMTSLALGAGADYTVVFRVSGTAAFLAYAMSSFPESIWKGLPWPVSFRFMFDGIVYALLTGGTFGWLWPGITN